MASATHLTLSSGRLTATDLAALHAHAISAPDEILGLFRRLHNERLPLHRGMNRMILPETALIETVTQDRIILATTNFARTGRLQIYFSFVLDGRPYFFASERIGGEHGGQLVIQLPTSVHHLERRDHHRVPTSGEADIVLPDGRSVSATVLDASPSGLAVRVENGVAPSVNSKISVQRQSATGSVLGVAASGTVLSRDETSSNGWVRLGLSLSPHRRGPALAVEDRSTIIGLSRVGRISQQVRIAAGGARALVRSRISTAQAPEIQLVEYENDDQEKMVGIIDGWGDPKGATAVVIPPAWGRTKETLLPLARTIVATFRRQKKPVVVLRFDGVRKRGESYNDESCRTPGSEQLKFTFSQGIRDLDASFRFLESGPRFQPRRIVIVSFSAASIETRRFIAMHSSARVAGWVCVVGTADMQSMMRRISGGVDFVRGHRDGVEFGLQEVLGVMVDMDHAGADAERERLSTIEDARADLAIIDTPIIWIRGKYDAWMDRGRIEDVLAVGDTSRRRLIDVPTGHQLKSSSEALDTFQLIAQEVAQLSLGRHVTPDIPNISELGAMQAAERRRLPRQAIDAEEFWRGYLLGREGELGIELMNETSNYRRLMETQIAGLQMQKSDRVLDIGAGTGAFPIAVARSGESPPAAIVEVDLVPEALERTRERMASLGVDLATDINYVAADVATAEGSKAILSHGPFDAAIGSLFLSYVDDPAAVLEAIAHSLRPGGRLVVSSLKPDADISRIYQEGVAEFEAGVLAGETFGLAAEDVRRAGRSFLNAGARLVDLEEVGAFRFYDRAQLAKLVRKAGFRVLASEMAFGSPPQAVVVVGQKR